MASDHRHSPQLIHDYFIVDLGILWRTATANVPEIASAVLQAAKSLEGEPGEGAL